MCYFSKMKYLSILILLFLSIFTSCKKEENTNSKEECSEEIIELEATFLEEESIAFVPYDSVSTIYFKNKNGKEISFVSFNNPTVRNDTSAISSFFTPCSSNGFNMYGYRRQNIRCSFNSVELDLAFEITVSTGVYFPEFLYYDRFSLRIRADSSFVFNDSNTLFIVTSDKGNNIDISTNYVFLEELTLNHKLFKNVYISIKKNNEPPTDLYFNKEFGVIGFTDMENKLWVLDRVE